MAEWHRLRPIGLRLCIMGILAVFSGINLVGCAPRTSPPPPLSPSFTLPPLFGDHMVLQQDSPIPVWGTAEPGKSVQVQLGGQSVRAVADQEGQWLVRLQPLPAGGPYEVVVEGDGVRCLFSNVMIGEVWFCSGQSNMAMPIKETLGAAEEITVSAYPGIRLFTVERTRSETPRRDLKGQWTECRPETSASFSAAAYYFGKEIHQKLGVPVGLIQSAWGGTPAEAWMRRETLESDPDFRPIFQGWEEMIARYPEAMKEHKVHLAEWEILKKKAEETGQPIPERPMPPKGPEAPQRPCFLYNAMVHPVIPYAIRGVIWYQGESNHLRAWQYRTLFPELIRSWRAEWGQGDFPFYYVQIAPYDYKINLACAELREAQTLALATPNTGMVCTLDIGDEKDIHPKNKSEVGKRLALLALANTYGKPIACQGPQFREMVTEGNACRIHFNHAQKGLVTTDSAPPLAFSIAGADKVFVPANARIEGDSILVWNERISAPLSVRYAYGDFMEVNLINTEGLPALPFRTDNEEWTTHEKLKP